MNAFTDDYRKKTPEEILEEVQKLQQGNLKLFIGFAAGVGKTFKMLLEAHDLKKEGIDVVVGLIETHNRKETADLIGSLEILPKQKVDYKGYVLEELDVDAIIERAPDVVLIDELAHHNIANLKNEKRYMDVEKILDYGINVLSTFNIQHLESLHDIVEKITGVSVRERIPDQILHTAHENILVDITPETLRKRLREGKIYTNEKIEQALNNFFKEANLSSLRELSLREVADDTDERMEKARLKNDQKEPTGVNEKILVCIQYNKSAEKLIRRGWRIASRLKVELHVLHVINKATPDSSQLKKIEAWKQLTSQFNATFHLQQNTSGKITSHLIEVSKKWGITQIILGQSARTRWKEIQKGSIVNDIMRKTNGIDIYIVSDKSDLK
ncbi:KdpD-like non-kinase potassium sensor [Lentibacillus halophilus]|uniref:KdpD-like non-kinase potassium sensor n=1 Tax=Lentibacillus halophilus TaxID=295065 RepID=A0ABP3J9V4_9BACI